MTETNGNTAVATVQPKLSLVASMAARFSMEPAPFLNTIKQTVFPQRGETASDAQVAAFLAVAHEYGLNPFTREIYAFPAKGGGIVPIVSIDGWLKMINDHPSFDGLQVAFEEGPDGKPFSCTITIHRKDRQHPTVVTEFYKECYRNTDPWNGMPHRMLRNRTMCQGGRIAFGFAGIMDEDEAETINITAASTELERTTNNKAQELKEKMNVKKEKKEKQEEIQQPKAPEPVAQPSAPEPTPTTQTPEELPFDPDTPTEDGERVLTEEERTKFIEVIRALGTTEEKLKKAQQATKTKMVELGYQNTKEIKFKHYAELLSWAKNLSI